MPVEIKELIIRAVTTLDAQEAAEGVQKQKPLDDQEAIVQACVKQVLRILKKKKER